MLGLLQRKTIGQIVRFGVATGVSASITLGLPTLLHEVFLVDEEVAFAAGLFVAFLVNFVTTRSLVFRSDGHVGRELGRYIFTSISFRLGEYLAFLILHTWLGVFYILAMILILTVAMIMKFVVLRNFVYRPDARSQICEPI